jgi:hypothetical protein
MKTSSPFPQLHRWPVQKQSTRSYFYRLINKIFKSRPSADRFLQDVARQQKSPRHREICVWDEIASWYHPALAPKEALSGLIHPEKAPASNAAETSTLTLISGRRLRDELFAPAAVLAHTTNQLSVTTYRCLIPVIALSTIHF